MRNYDRAQTINQSLRKIILDGLNIPSIRKELEAGRVEQDEIKIVIRYLDDQLIKYDQLKAQKSIGLFSIAAGLLALLLGLFITVGSYIGFIDMGNVFLITYGPVLIGLGGIGYGFIQVKKLKDFKDRNKLN